MKIEEKFELLAKRAAGENAPKLDISANVLHILAANKIQNEYVSARGLMWTALGSAAIAAAALVVALFQYYSTAPLAEVLKSISWIEL